MEGGTVSDPAPGVGVLAPGGAVTPGPGWGWPREREPHPTDQSFTRLFVTKGLHSKVWRDFLVIHALHMGRLSDRDIAGTLRLVHKPGRPPESGMPPEKQRILVTLRCNA